MSCLKDVLVNLLSTKVTIDMLANIKDKKDKLESRLYQRKVDAFLLAKAKKLQFCSQCRKLFTDEQNVKAVCY